jgi:hypothetical protein
MCYLVVFGLSPHGVVYKNSSDAKFLGKLILQAAYFVEIGRLSSSYAA